MAIKIRNPVVFQGNKLHILLICNGKVLGEIQKKFSGSLALKHIYFYTKQ